MIGGQPSEIPASTTLSKIEVVVRHGELDESSAGSISNVPLE
jgi:hypothetical protein